MTEDVFAGFPARQAGAEGGGLDPLAPEHVAPLVGYLVSPAAARQRATARRARRHGGGRRTAAVAAKFDTKQDAFTYDELDALLSPHYAGARAGRRSRRRRYSD